MIGFHELHELYLSYLISIRDGGAKKDEQGLGERPRALCLPAETPACHLATWVTHCRVGSVGNRRR